MVPLAKATTTSCGAKAAACAELAQLAQKGTSKGGYGTAEGVCLPFGCMEAVIQVTTSSLPEKHSQYWFDARACLLLNEYPKGTIWEPKGALHDPKGALWGPKMASRTSACPSFPPASSWGARRSEVCCMTAMHDVCSLSQSQCVLQPT